MSARYNKLRRTSRWIRARGDRRWKSRRIPTLRAPTRNPRTGCTHPTRICHAICPSKPAVTSPGVQRECPARTCWSALIEEARHDG